MEKVLLHVCCGPCSIMPVQKLCAKGFEPQAWFYNPNIHPLSEYLRRRAAAEECAQKLNIFMEFDDSWDLNAWLKMQGENPEAPERCKVCCSARLREAARHAAATGMRYFSTSLLYSRYQPHDYIREAGYALGREFGIEFIYDDFRIYWQEGIDQSLAWEIYRQAWCGCIFSEAERYAKKLLRLQKNNALSLDK